IEGEPLLQQMRDSDETVARLMEIAGKLEGLYRHASTHAAGVVIGDRPLQELVPLYRDPRSPLPATQFNLKYVETAGLVKFDFLGLTTLTILARAVELLNKRGISLDLDKLPLDDKLAYDLMARACAICSRNCGPTASRTSSRWSRSIVPARWRTSRATFR